MSLEEELRRIIREEFDRARKEYLGREASSKTEPEEFLTKVHAAGMAGVSVRVIDKWIRDEVIKTYGSGSTLRVRRSEVMGVLGAPHVKEPTRTRK